MIGVYTLVEYLVIALIVYLSKCFAVKWWVVMILACIAVGLSGTKYSKIGNKTISWVNFESILLGLVVLLFPGLKARVLLLAFAGLLFSVNGHDLENGASDNNEYSFSNLLIPSVTMHLLVNIYFIFNPGTGNRFLNIVYVIALFLLLGNLMVNLSGVQEYDKEYREKKENYERSAFAKATQLSYKQVINDTGLFGEYCTSTWLTDIRHPYKELYSVSIPEKTELGSTEIDSIVITLSGLYAIEVKNRKLKWLIDGNDPTAYCYDSYGKKREERNPVLQNQRHLNSLKNFILHSGNEEVIKAFKTLDSTVIGYVAFGPETIDFDVTNTCQGACEYTEIGKCISRSVERRYDCSDEYSYDYIRREDAIEVLYNFLLKYQNNTELKRKHDTLLKIKDFKK